MKNNLFLVLFFIAVFVGEAQTIEASEKFNLPTTIEETSGLTYFNNKLITHNDSGNTPQLFELDTISGIINRTVTISNATNVDWEDIAQDTNYLYIGDIGNNSGSRTDLKVYRILKSEFLANTSVTADVINYAYADQVDFTPNLNNTNWDAEGLIVWGDYLFIFSKNWINNEVDLYVIPKVPGTYTATKEDSFNAQGLVTAVERSPNSDTVYLLGYSEDSITPFLIMLTSISIDPPSNFALFSNSVKIRFDNFVGLGNQVEGICFIVQNNGTDRMFMSNEKFVFGPATFDPKLRSVDINNETLSSNFEELSEIKLTPNPFSNVIQISERVEGIQIYDALGRLVVSLTDTNTVPTTVLPNGMFYVHVRSSKGLSVFKMVK